MQQLLTERIRTEKGGSNHGNELNVFHLVRNPPKLKPGWTLYGSKSEFKRHYKCPKDKSPTTCFSPHPPKRYKERGPPKSKKDFANEETIYKIGSSKQQDLPAVTTSSDLDEEANYNTGPKQDLPAITGDEFSKLFSSLCFGKHPFEFIPEAKVMEPLQLYCRYFNSSKTIKICCFSKFKMDDILVQTVPIVILQQDRVSPSSASASTTNSLTTIFQKLKLKDLQNEVSQVCFSYD